MHRSLGLRDEDITRFEQPLIEEAEIRYQAKHLEKLMQQIAAITYYNLGVTLYAQGKLDEAIAAFRKAIQIDPNYLNAHLNLGVTLYTQGKLDEAIAAYRKAIQIDPNFVDAHFNLGFTLYVQGKLDEAIAAYRKVIQIDPNYVNAHNNLEVALKAQGKKKFLGLF